MATDPPQSSSPMTNHVTSRDRWGEFSDRWSAGPYGLLYGSPEPAIYRPSVTKDLRQVAREILRLRFSNNFFETIFVMLMGGVVFVVWNYTFWALWERSAWTWNRTDRIQLQLDGKPNCPPAFRHKIASAVLASAITLPVLVAWLSFIVLMGHIYGLLGGAAD